MPMSRLLVGTPEMSLPRHQNRAGVGVLEAGQHPQRGGLSAAGRPEQHDHLARGDVQAHVVQRVHRAEADRRSPVRFTETPPAGPPVLGFGR